MSAQVPVAQLGTVDYITAVVVLVIAVGVSFGAAAVVRFYSEALGHSPRKHGLLLWHVVAVGVSVAGTWLTLALGQLAILGILDTPRAIRLIGYAVCGLGTMASLVLIGMQQRRRVRRIPPEYPGLQVNGERVDGDR